jgi:hypothetical protein
MIRFREYITESAKDEIFKMFNPVKKIYDLMDSDGEDRTWYMATRLMRGAVEPWVGDMVNIKTNSRGDVLRRTIPRKLANQNGIYFTDDIDEKMALQIISFFRKFPAKYENWRFSPYQSLTLLEQYYYDLKHARANGRIIQWFFKLCKANIVAGMIGYDNYENKEIINYIRKVYLSIKLDSVNEDTYNKILTYGHIDGSMTEIKNIIGHYTSLNIPEINNYDPKNKSYSVVVGEFSDFEDDWKNNQPAKEIEDISGVTELYNFGDGTSWFNLNKEYCELEGDAMKHCGNKAAWREGDRVLSLRTVTKDNKHYPLLTFVINSNGVLGEAKAKANSKPPEKYHKKIIKLLTLKHPNGSWLITGVDGGQFLRDNDFKLDDLSNDDTLQLKSIRPDLYKNEII